MDLFRTSLLIPCLASAAIAAWTTQAYIHPTPINVLTAEQAEILGHMSIVQIDNGVGGTCKTIRITGVNVQIVNGLGATNGNPGNPTTTANGATTVNGVGNLIVGYNETQNQALPRTGSHSVIIGRQNGYSSFGALVAGAQNSAVGAHDSVVGGTNNVAGFSFTSILGGIDNATVGQYSAIGGGISNRANSDWSFVAGGQGNSANAAGASISGGGGVVVTDTNVTGVGTLFIDP